MFEDEGCANRVGVRTSFTKLAPSLMVHPLVFESAYLKYPPERRLTFLLR